MYPGSGQRSVMNRGGQTGNMPETGTPVNTAGKYPNGVWIQFATPEEYRLKELKLFELTSDSDGSDPIVIFVKNPKGIKVLPPNRNVCWNEQLKTCLEAEFGADNVKFRRG